MDSTLLVDSTSSHQVHTCSDAEGCWSALTHQEAARDRRLQPVGSKALSQPIREGKVR